MVSIEDGVTVDRTGTERKGGRKGLQLLHLGGKISREEFWCRLLPARSQRGGSHLGHGGRAAREIELGRAIQLASALSVFSYQQLTASFTEMV